MSSQHQRDGNRGSGASWHCSTNQPASQNRRGPGRGRGGAPEAPQTANYLHTVGPPPGSLQHEGGYNQPLPQNQRGTHTGYHTSQQLREERMEVDDHYRAPPRHPESGRQEGPSRKKKNKGKQKAPPTDHEEDDHQGSDEDQASILATLEREGVGLVVARDAVRNPSAVLVFDQLTTTIEDLRRDLERANDARKRAENQLVATRGKRPASPPSPQQGEIDYRPRKVRGHGDLHQGFSAARTSDREGSSAGPSGSAITRPVSADVSSGPHHSTGQSSIQSSRAPSEVRPTHSEPTGPRVAGPSSHRQQVAHPQREHRAPSEDFEMRRRQPSPTPWQAEPRTREEGGRGGPPTRGRGGRRADEDRPPAPIGNPYLAPPEIQPWPVVDKTPPNLLRDDPPLPPPPPSPDADTPFHLSDDNGESDTESVVDNRTPSERERDAHQRAVDFHHR